MATFRQFMIQIFLVGLFAIALIAGAINLQTDNNADSIVTESAALNRSYNSLIEQLNTANQTVDAQSNAFQSDTAGTNGFNFDLTSIVGVMFTFMRTAFNFTAVFVETLSDTLGIPSLVLGVISMIIIVTAMFLGWRAVRGGE